jgi:O-succinylbenzoate synthase
MRRRAFSRDGQFGLACAMKAFLYQLFPRLSPLELNGRLLTVRAGLLIESDSGWGDAAPLPGFSRDTVDDLVIAWRHGPPFAAPPLRFAYESAQAVLPSLAVPVAPLLTGSSAAIVDAAGRLGKTDCRSIKLKVGRTPRIAEDIELVRTVRRLLRADQSLRVDANRAWDRDTAVVFGKAVGELAVEYIEEPTVRAEDCEFFSRQTGCRYALDETLLERDTLDDFPNAAALIIKPTLVGGVADIDRLAGHKKPLVFSACFESGIGILHVGRLAARYAPDVPAGLGTYSHLEGDVLASRLVFDHWTLRLDQPVAVDLTRLAEVRP